MSIDKDFSIFQIVSVRDYIIYSITYQGIRLIRVKDSLKFYQLPWIMFMAISYALNSMTNNNFMTGKTYNPKLYYQIIIGDKIKCQKLMKH